MNTLYTIPIRRADQTETNLQPYQGKVLLLVNVASKCGLTPQYDALETIHEKLSPRGFSVLAFPANEFGAQEPGTDVEIQEFCRLNYDVKFPVFAKLVVKGSSQHPLYAYLTRECPVATKKGNPIWKFVRQMAHPGSFTGEAGEITWNFEKFLIARDGSIAARFSPQVTPDDPVLLAAIEEELSKH